MRALEAIITLGPRTAGRNAQVMGGCLERTPTLKLHEAAMNKVKAVWLDLCNGKSVSECAYIHELSEEEVRGIEIIMRADNF